MSWFCNLASVFRLNQYPITSSDMVAEVWYSYPKWQLTSLKDSLSNQLNCLPFPYSSHLAGLYCMGIEVTWGGGLSHVSILFCGHKVLLMTLLSAAIQAFLTTWSSPSPPLFPSSLSSPSLCGSLIALQPQTSTEICEESTLWVSPSSSAKTLLLELHNCPVHPCSGLTVSPRKGMLKP